ncbi:MAG: hypothetical protein AB1609_11630 [Bacillota bacterium]
MGDGGGSVAIHPAAFVHPAACLEAPAEVGPFARIEAGARVGAGARIGVRAYVGPGTSMGEGCFIDVGAVLGSPAAQEQSVILGRGVRVREYAVVEAGPPGRPTRVDDEAFVMAKTWMGPGSHLGARAILTHGSVMQPGAELHEDAIVGGYCLVEAGVVIGRRAMVGALSRVDIPVPPFTLAHGNPAALYGLNVVGLRRAGVPAETRQKLQRAFRVLFRSALPLEHAEAELGADALAVPEVQELLRFVQQFPHVTARAPGRERTGELDGSSNPEL